MVAEGAQVHYVVCTRGGLGGEDPAVASKDLELLRCDEQRAAAEFLGVASVEFLDFPDGALEPGQDLRRELARRIRKIRPSVVLSHQPLRSLEFPIGASHPDHLAVGEAAMRAVYPDARNPRAFPELLGEGLEAHKVAEVWVPGHEHTDFFVDVTGLEETKIAAILKHKSQFLESADPRDDLGWVATRMATFGERAGCGGAEGFKRVVTDHFAVPSSHISTRS